MKIKIVALRKDEDFKTLLKGRKLSNKYFINVIADRPAPITNIFFIFNFKILG